MKNLLLSIAFLCILVSTSFATATLLGDLGTHRTFSGKTLGHGKLSLGISGNGAYDDNRIEGGSVKRYILRFDTAQGQPFDELQDSSRIDEIFDLTARLYATLGITHYFDLGVSLPIHSDWLTGAAVSENEQLSKASSLGIGDLEIMGKLQYPPYEHDALWEMAFLGILTIPTGSPEKGFIPKKIWYIPQDSVHGAQYYTADALTLALILANTLDFREIDRDLRVLWHLNFGIQTTSNASLDNSFMLSSSLQWKPSGEIFGLFLEFSGVTRMSKFSNGFNLAEDPLFLTPGFTVEAENGMQLSVGMDFCLTRGQQLSQLRMDPEPGPSAGDALCRNCSGDGAYSAYRVRPAAPIGLSATLGWSGFLVSQDRDKDGIPDEEDRCPTEAEDFDGFEDEDGCPDPDNDGDSIPDQADRCPLVKEDFDGYEDEDGCPELDNDRDGIPDARDKCPNAAEDFNGFQDDDGCPDGKADSDKDGIADHLDQCVLVPEDHDGFQDHDGCPDLDNDMDSIPDHLDRCPNAAEIYNGFEDEDGCPDQIAAKPVIIEKVVEKVVEKIVEKRDTIVQVRKDTVIVEKIIEIERKATVILHGVNFATGSAELTPESFSKLEEVAYTLKKSPAIVLEIRGHTDDKGLAKTNLKLSQERAESVCRYLMAQGVPASQLKATGYGSKMPIASNKTAAGREKNRRIEMYRVE